VVQGITPSARLAQGYKVTARGVELAREAGSIQPDPVTRSSTDPVFGSGLNSFFGKNKERTEPTKQDRIGLARELDRSSSPDPVPLPSVVTLELGPETLRALLSALGVQICRCGHALVERERGKDGMRFLGCVKGKAGCGVTLPVRGQPYQRREDKPALKALRPAKDLSTMTLADALQRTADARKA
jgi:hypothetical protein